jgi:NADH dehydrogenase
VPAPLASQPDSGMGTDLPHIVIVGAGFGGLACAKALGGAACRVTVVDRNNYHLFVPLLYQVATAGLSPADIAEAVRKILRRHRNIDVVLGTVVGVDRIQRTVQLSDGNAIAFDILVLATGSAYNYFGRPEWEAYAPGLKSIADARALRSRLLRAFELAEREPDPTRQRALLTTVIVGGGPTGVEIAGAVAELARFTLVDDFRHVDPTSARIILVEAGPRILANFPDSLAKYAQQRLENLGVEVRVGTAVADIAPGHVMIDDERLSVGTVIWGAGIRASPAGEWAGATLDHIGRACVRPDLSIAEEPDIFVLGDSAFLVDPDTRRPLPGLAQVAQQQGRHLGAQLRRRLSGWPAMAPFRFSDRGNTAIIGRNAAIFDFGRRQLQGWFAWILWAIIHVYLLVGFEKRMLVTLQWLWRYATYQRGARLIIPDEDADRATPDL